MKRKALILFVFIFIILNLTGCSLTPIYYSDNYVKNYAKDVFGKDTKFVEEKSQKKDDGTTEYQYTFKDKRGISFCVTSSSYHDCYQNLFYSRGIKDNYDESMITHYKDDIKSELSNISIETEFPSYSYIGFYLTDYKQTKETAKIISNIDNILALDSDYSKYYSYTPDEPLQIEVFLKPNDNEETDDWKEGYDYSIGRIETTTKEPRITQEKANAFLEKKIADKIKDKNATYYSLPDELLYKYPANNIKITSINNVAVDNGAFTLKYDDLTEKYWIYSYDLCEESENEDTSDENFSKIVTLLGGTYKEKNLTATWSIGKNVWKAKYNRDEHGNSENFEIKKNNQEIKLNKIKLSEKDDYYTKFFTLEDFEKMLDVEVKIDQVKMTATINKKG